MGLAAAAGDGQHHEGTGVTRADLITVADGAGACVWVERDVPPVVELLAGVHDARQVRLLGHARCCDQKQLRGV